MLFALCSAESFLQLASPLITPCFLFNADAIPIRASIRPFPSKSFVESSPFFQERNRITATIIIPSIRKVSKPPVVLISQKSFKEIRSRYQLTSDPFDLSSSTKEEKEQMSKKEEEKREEGTRAIISNSFHFWVSIKVFKPHFFFFLLSSRESKHRPPSFAGRGEHALISKERWRSLPLIGRNRRHTVFHGWPVIGKEE